MQDNNKQPEVKSYNDLYDKTGTTTPHPTEPNQLDEDIQDILDDFIPGSYIPEMALKFKYLIAKAQREARIDEHRIIIETYAELYNRISKQHGIEQPVPRTAFHQIIKDRLEELNK